MSRTYRNTDGMHKYALRYPKTENERKQLDGVLHDCELFEFPVSKFNHMRSRENNLPSCWDDKVISAYYQQDYEVS
jgi:hypothetical protein